MKSWKQKLFLNNEPTMKNLSDIILPLVFIFAIYCDCVKFKEIHMTGLDTNYVKEARQQVPQEDRGKSASPSRKTAVFWLPALIFSLILPHDSTDSV